MTAAAPPRGRGAEADTPDAMIVRSAPMCSTTRRSIASRARRLGLLVALVAAGCTRIGPEPPPKAVPTGPQRLCVGGEPQAREHCRTPAEVEAVLRSEALEVLRARPTPGGAQGASVLTVRAPPDHGIFEVKWRPQSTAGEYNDPAAERIAYETQSLLLAPRDYVIPPTVGRCLPIAQNGWWMSPPIRAYPGTGCALGSLSYWLPTSTTLRQARREGLFPTPERGGVWSADPLLYDRERFDADARYRRAIANLNAVVFLIGHGDAHTGQFVMYRDPLHLFVVDNSVAFGVRRNREMAGRQDLAELWVPALPAEIARRLARARPEDVRALARVDGYARTEGRLEPAALEEIIGDPSERVRDDGARVQVGLRSAELDDLSRRLRHLRDALDRGELETFDDR